MAIQGDDELDATTLAGQVRKKELHPSELVDEAISRIKALNPSLNAMAGTGSNFALHGRRMASTFFRMIFF
jgi:amidase